MNHYFSFLALPPFIFFGRNSDLPFLDFSRHRWLFYECLRHLYSAPEMQRATGLVPALQSNWLMMHVTTMIVSYAALMVGCLLSMAFLIVQSCESRPEPASPSSPHPLGKEGDHRSTTWQASGTSDIRLFLACFGEWHHAFSAGSP
jgi:hypothetical protein